MPQASQAQPALDWALVESEATPLHFEVGGHALPDGLLRRSLLQLRETYAEINPQKNHDETQLHLSVAGHACPRRHYGR